MTLTLSQLDTRLAIRLGDRTSQIWAADERQQALTEACEEAWLANFFVITEDFTTYTGANAVAMNTAEIAVPATFIANPNPGGIAQPGLISAIEVRETGTVSYTEPLIQRWFFVKDGVKIDDLSQSSPKIRFANPWNIITEIRLYGAMPIVCPSTPSQAVPGTDNTGAVSWLLTTALAKCCEMRVTRDSEDQRSYFRRMVLARQDADKIKSKSAMSFPHLTNFQWSS